MQLTLENLLFATDLSRNSDMAFGHAAGLAKLAGAGIHILHALRPMSDDEQFTLQAFLQDDQRRHEIVDLRIERARRLLAEKQDEFWASQTDEDRKVRDRIASITVCEAYPAEAILQAAKAHRCDLIVMSSHERGLSRTFLGSVSKSVLRRSSVPVLVVPPGSAD